MNILENEITAENFPLEKLNYYKVSFTWNQLNTLVNCVNEKLLMTIKRKLCCEKYGKNTEYLNELELVLKEIIYILDDARKLINVQRIEYKKQTLDRGTKPLDLF